MFVVVIIETSKRHPVSAALKRILKKKKGGRGYRRGSILLPATNEPSALITGLLTFAVATAVASGTGETTQCEMSLDVVLA